jgi:hypothetical protein
MRGNKAEDEGEPALERVPPVSLQQDAPRVFDRTNFAGSSEVFARCGE